MLCVNVATSQSSHSPPEHRCPWLPAGHVPHTQHGPVPPGEGAAACPRAQAWSMCARSIGTPRVPPPLSCPGPEHPERSVHLAAKQNKPRFLRFPTQLPRLALFPVFIFIHILVLFYGRAPRPGRRPRWPARAEPAGGLPGRRRGIGARGGSSGESRCGLGRKSNVNTQRSNTEEGCVKTANAGDGLSAWKISGKQ